MIMLIATQVALADQVIESIEPAEFVAHLDSLRSAETPHTLLDIRTYPEYQQGHIEHSQQLDFYGPNYINQLKELPKDVPYLIYCRSGNRTNQTLAIMKQLGFQKVYDLKGGIKNWLRSGYKLVR